MTPEPEATRSTVPTRSARDQRSARRAFLAAALRRPATVGAVVPSSARLAEVLAAVVPREGSPVVVELGPGTGAVSAVISRRLPPTARHLAVELDPQMVAYLRRNRPDLEVVPGDATHLAALLAERGIHRVDAVIGGLPWALFDQPAQEAILGQISQVVGATGAFTTFTYLPSMALAAARRFRATLRATFDEVLVSSTVWRNVPPAFVYVCRRPIAGPFNGLGGSLSGGSVPGSDSARRPDHAVADHAVAERSVADRVVARRSAADSAVE